MTYEQALDYIHAIHWQGHKPGLERTHTLLEALGRPQDKLRFVHSGHQRQGQHRRHAGQLSAAGRLQDGTVYFPFYQSFK